MVWNKQSNHRCLPISMVYSLWPYNNGGALRDFLPEPIQIPGYGDPLEDSRCGTQQSEIQTSSETRSKPPPDPPHPIKTSPTNRASDNGAYRITYQTRQRTLKTILEKYCK